MRNRHLIALDLDGTLLTGEQKISKKTKRIILKAKEAGHIVMIATGRPYRSSEMYYRELDLTTPIVNFNGAFVHHPRDNNWEMFHEPLALNTVNEIVESCLAYQFQNIVAEVLDDVYMHYHDEKLIDFFRLTKPQFTIGDLRTFLKSNPTSMLIHAKELDVPMIRNHLSDVHAEVINHRRWGAPWHVIEIGPSGLNKSIGIQKVADHYHIPREQIIAFGDEDNDLEMIDHAGIGVAMGNGIDALKSIANEITLSNEEDGIGIFLEERLNLK